MFELRIVDQNHNELCTYETTQIPSIGDIIFVISESQGAKEDASWVVLEVYRSIFNGREGKTAMIVVQKFEEEGPLWPSPFSNN